MLLAQLRNIFFGALPQVANDIVVVPLQLLQTDDLYCSASRLKTISSEEAWRDIQTNTKRLLRRDHGAEG